MNGKVGPAQGLAGLGNTALIEKLIVLLLFLAFLSGGAASVPRRYAVHLPGWLPYDRIGVIGAGLVVTGTLLLVIRFFLTLRSPMPEDGAPS